MDLAVDRRADARTTRPPWRRLLLVLLICCTAPGCGWHAGLEPPGGARTVGVEIFTTGEGVLERNLEPLLHRELSRAVTDLVGAPLVSAGEADLVLRGRIMRYRRRSGVRNKDHELIETGVQVSARAELVDRLTGRVVRPAVEASLWSGYVLGDLEAEDAARDRVLRNICETMVLDLFRPRTEPPPGANVRGDAG